MNTTSINTPAIRSVAGGSAYDTLAPEAAAARQTLSGASESASAVSWSAIFCGAAVAAAVTVLLVELGAGLGLASVSPWTAAGVSATTFTAITAIWFVVTQWIAAGVGGYITGRLRTRWVGVHTHEVFFRDTAHGFATWAVGSLFVAAALSMGTLVMGAVGKSAATLTSAAAGSAAGSYDTDVLMRGGSPDDAPQLQAEAMRILTKGLASNQGVSAADRAYLSGRIAAHSGVSQSEAVERVDVFLTNGKAAADAARKTAAAIALFAAFSMLIGAFVACVGAALGGQWRDRSETLPS